MDTTSQGRVTAAIFLLAALPAIGAWITVDPAVFWRTGVSNYLMLAAPFILLAATWNSLPAVQPARPHRLWITTWVLLALALLNAAVIAPMPFRSFLALSTIFTALATGWILARAFVQNRQIGFAFAAALLVATPLYAVTLPVMDMLYDPGAEGLGWTHSLPGVRHIRKAGHLFTISALAGLGLMLVRPRIWIVVLTVFALALIGWSGGRGAYLAIAVGATLALLATGRFTDIRAWALLIVTVLAGFALSPLVPIPDHVPDLGLQYGLDRQQENLTTGRVDFWRDALRGIGAVPLTGLGWGQFPALRSGPPSHTHNIVMDLLLGLGLIAGSIAILVLVRIWFMAQKARSDETLPALMVLNGMVVQAFLSGTYFYGLPQTFTAMAAALCLAAAARPPGRAETSAPS